MRPDAGPGRYHATTPAAHGTRFFHQYGIGLRAAAAFKQRLHLAQVESHLALHLLPLTQQALLRLQLLHIVLRRQHKLLIAIVLGEQNQIGQQQALHAQQIFALQMAYTVNFFAQVIAQIIEPNQLLASKSAIALCASRKSR